MNNKKEYKQFILCPICGNEIFEPRYKDRPYRCKWCRTVITDWSEAEKVVKRK